MHICERKEGIKKEFMLEELLVIPDRDFLKDHLLKFWIVIVDEKVSTKYKIIVYNSKCKVVETI